MKELAIYLLLTSFFFLVSCEPQHTALPAGSAAFLETSNDSPVTLLFSNEEQIKEENSYYNALLDFKRNHPESLEKIDIISSNDTKLVTTFDIQVFPTLLVVEDTDVIVRVEGTQDAENIYSMLKSNLVQK